MFRYPSTAKKVNMAKAVIRDFPGLHSGNHIQGGYVSGLAALLYTGNVFSILHLRYKACV